MGEQTLFAGKHLFHYGFVRRMTGYLTSNPRHPFIIATDCVQHYRIPYRRSELQKLLDVLRCGRGPLLFQKRFGAIEKNFGDLRVRKRPAGHFLSGRSISSRKRLIVRRVGSGFCYVGEPVEENGSGLVTGVGLENKLQRMWPAGRPILTARPPRDRQLHGRKHSSSTSSGDQTHGIGVIMSTQVFIWTQRHASDADHPIRPSARKLSGHTQFSPEVRESLYIRYRVGCVCLVEPLQPLLAILN